MVDEWRGQATASAQIAVHSTRVALVSRSAAERSARRDRATAGDS
ncbi:hypothetical protein ACFFRL_08665 [Agromyces hippuratus]